MSSSVSLEAMLVQHTEDARSVMPHLYLETLFLTLENSTLSLFTFRRQLKHFYFSHY